MIQAAEEASRRPLLNAPNGLRVTPHFIFEEVKPEADETAQLLSLSDRVRKGELYLIIDISADALLPSSDPGPRSPSTFTAILRVWINRASRCLPL